VEPTTNAAETRPRLQTQVTPPNAPEVVVARKLATFARSRRALAEALARKHGIEVPEAVQEFFAAVEQGHWNEIEAAFQRINGGDSSAGHASERDPKVNQLWPAIIDAFGVAEQVHEWPARELLDYGETILGSLRPGMMYVGGTDNGRWIPELINETSDGEKHIIITQNGLADSTYLEYVQLQYGDRIQIPTREEAEKIFSEYIADAQRRLKHDQENPNEPRQVRTGENLEWNDGRFQVSGSTAVMAINEKLLQSLLEKNPDLPVALQESFPLRGTYGDALPLGPIFELNARGDETPFTPERAAQSRDLWTSKSHQFLDPGRDSLSDSALKSYSHDATAAANLLASHQFSSEAEQIYQVSRQLWPANPEPVAALANLLNRTGRDANARGLIEEFVRDHPDQLDPLRKLNPSLPFPNSPPPPAPPEP